ncbi:glycoside hydrolase family 18 protein [Photobacterium lipolyticum]|uniref:chitinase n=1 Tax=Photobacterium lipolyticum TaxID=266810 RepID=A0A2T3MUY0_9GAMM|nr:glycoside hydrolase family 18 protein [Photobacterium lipolyticum]PSW03764.1 chitinase [Photobacterium lipolyticum]
MKHTLTAALIASLLAPAALADQQVIAGYFADWQYANEQKPYTVKDIPADKLTHVIYAFLSMCGPHTGASEKVQQQVALACKNKAPFSAIIVDREAALDINFGDVSVNVPYHGHFAQLAELKKQHPDLKILPSFGGWTMSEPFHAMAKDHANIRHFAKTAVELIAEYDFFDGIDLDWEYPGGSGHTTSPWNENTKLPDEQKAAERSAFTFLVKTLRAELDQLENTTKRDYELSTAVGVGPKAAQIDWAGAAPHLTNMFAMTYDFLGGWGQQTGHLTNLHATERSWWGGGADAFINQMIEIGSPSEKLVLGAAYYGRGWEGTQGFDGKLPTASLISEKGASFGTDEDEPGYFMYWDLKQNYTPEQGYKYSYDKAAEAPFLWHPENKVFISFDDKRSVKAKTEWVKQKGLAGMFTWELSGDPTGELTETMYQALKGDKS